MDQISYQNGFICGLAAKGLTRSGQLYQPNVYNDDGVYTYFYIDFRRAMSTFSFGMFAESIIVYDSVQLPITATEKVSTTVYKVYCDITGLPHGFTVINKKTCKIRFADGEIVPPFSIHAFVEGQSKYLDGGYIYETIPLPILDLAHLSETPSTDLWDAIDGGSISESITIPVLDLSNIAETPSIVLT